MLTKNHALLRRILQHDEGTIEWNFSFHGQNLFIIVINQQFYCEDTFKVLIEYVIHSNRMDLVNEVKVVEGVMYPLITCAIHTEHLSAVRILLAHGISTNTTNDFVSNGFHFPVNKKGMVTY